MRKVTRLSIIFLIAFFFCNCTYRYDIYVYMSKDLKEYYGYYPSVEVDIAGINEEENNWLDSYDIDKYFEVRNQLRVSMQPMTMKFSQNNIGVQHINKNSNFWNDWKKKGAKTLYIIANLPEKIQQSKDSRKLMFKIQSNLFRPRCKYIEIKREGLISLPCPVDPDRPTERKYDAF